MTSKLNNPLNLKMADFNQKASQLANSLVYMLKSIDEADKKNAQMNIENLKPSSITYSKSEVESNIKLYLESIRRRMEENELILQQMYTPFPQLDTGNSAYTSRYKNLLDIYEEIKKVEKLSNRHLNTSKSMILQNKDEIKYLTKSNFEIYVDITKEVYKTPDSTSIYSKIVSIWKDCVAEFYSIFNKVTSSNLKWGDIPEPIKFENDTVVEIFDFKDSWYNQGSNEFNIIELVSSDLAIIFNRLVIQHPEKFKPVFGDYYPFATDVPQEKRPFIKLFQEKYTDKYFGEAKGSFSNKTLGYNDYGVLTARGEKIILTSFDPNDCSACNSSENEFFLSQHEDNDFDLSTNDDENNIIINIAGARASKRKRPLKRINKRIKKKPTYNKNKNEAEDETSDEENHSDLNQRSNLVKNSKLKSITSADLSKLMSLIRISYNNTSQNYQNITEDVSNIYNSLDKHAGQLFNQRINPPQKISISDLETIIARCESMLQAENNSTQLENAKSYFKKILLGMLEQHKKNNTKPIYINSILYPEFCKMWGYVLDLADRRSDQFTKLTIIKENNYNNKDKKLIDNNNEHFKIFEDDKYLLFKFSNSLKTKYVDNQYKILMESLRKDIAFYSNLKNYISDINNAIESSIEFKEWFSGTKVLDINRKFINFKDLSKLNGTFDIKNIPSSITHPLVNQSDLFTNEYLKNVFIDQSPSKDINVSWPNTNLNNWPDIFNEMLRGFYGQVYFLDEALQLDNKIIANMDFNPSLNNNKQTRPILANKIYPTCYSTDCPHTRLTGDLYHEHRLNVHNSKNYDYPMRVQFKLNIGQFNTNMSLPIILLLQFKKESFGYDNNSKKFDLTFIDKQINELQLKQAEIDKLKNDEPFKLSYDLYVKTDKSMAEILAYANADRVMINQGNTLTFVQGPSGSGKSNAINGNNMDKKGFFESISAIDPNNTKCQPVIFEYYHVAMPFKESFLDSVNTKQSKPRIWYFQINQDNPSDISAIPVDNFKINETISIETYNRNFSTRNGIRETIDGIRKNTIDTTRPFPTIYSTTNNPESSRSTYIQAMKLTKNDKSSYNIVLDRPGEEDPYSTFNINDNIEKIKLSNPLYAVNMNLADKFFKNYPANSFKYYFNAISFVNFEKKNFKEYLSSILGKDKQEKNSSIIDLFPNLNFYQNFKYTKGETKQSISNKYIKHMFLNDLDKFFNENAQSIIAFRDTIEKYFVDNLPKEAFDFMKNIHKNSDWLDFSISVEDFQDYIDKSTNMYVNGFAENSIKIKDLFPMHEYKQYFDNHAEKINESPFCKFFFEDNFFNQIACPLLGWLLKELGELVGKNTSLFDKDFIKEEFLLTPNNIILKHGNNLELSFVDHSVKHEDNSNYMLANKEIKLGFDFFMSLSKYGNQSFLNSWNTIASFLTTTASYFSLFKNISYCDFYDKKIEIFHKFSNLNPTVVRQFSEAVSINEINANQRRIMASQMNKIQVKAPTLNTMLYNTMYLMSDLILPQIELTKNNRNLRFSNLATIDMTLGSETKSHFRIEFPFKILKPDSMDCIQIDKSNNSNLLYSMTQVYNDNDDWLVTKKNWEEQAKLYYISDSTNLVRVMIFNCYTAGTPSGNLSYYLYF